ncbi:MAG: beta-ketoacyl-[acyl-carrier-protein] synthase family protein [Gammaproteobacteria bacterium]|nr:beta-ketoacyl-[acyl-carrier-protein] synthase family protein [Gammaproteobacteria bacterium]
MKPLHISAYTTVSALGRGNAAMLEALRAGKSGLQPLHFPPAELKTYVGFVEGLEHEPLPEELAAFECRNNRLARLALRQDDFEQQVAALRERHGASRVAVLIGTSTSGILNTELAFRRRNEAGELPVEFDFVHSHQLSSLVDFVRRLLQLQGPGFTVSTACSSSAKVFADAWRLMAAGLCDAAVVGGVDSLCLTTLYGFNSLELVSAEPCRPADSQRNGISIGEAAGFAILEREPVEGSRGQLLGFGESSDAYHMSTPHPDGLGAVEAMQAALARAGLASSDIDYINLHGTATPSNDRSEDRAITTVFGTNTPCSSTKGWTGHTLGAAGITEAIIAMQCIEHGLMPASLNTRQLDPDFGSTILLEQRETTVNRVLSNSFGFGGSNCSLIFGGRNDHPLP